MASSNTANWSVYSRNREAHVEGLLSWFEGPKYLLFALSGTRMHLTPTSYQQTRQLFIRHKLAHQSQIRELPSGRPQSKGWERKGGLWLTALPFAQSTSPLLSYFAFSIKLRTASQVKLQNTWSQNEKRQHRRSRYTGSDQSRCFCLVALQLQQWIIFVMKLDTNVKLPLWSSFVTR